MKPMKLSDNMNHQVTIACANLLAEALTDNVDITGWRLLDKPVVKVASDGTITMQIATPDAGSVTPSRSRRASKAAKVTELEPDAEEEPAAEQDAEADDAA